MKANPSKADSVADCCALCRKNAKCQAFTWVARDKNCWLKGKSGNDTPHIGCYSGTPNLPPAAQLDGLPLDFWPEFEQAIPADLATNASPQRVFEGGDQCVGGGPDDQKGALNLLKFLNSKFPPGARNGKQDWGVYNGVCKDGKLTGCKVNDGRPANFHGYARALDFMVPMTSRRIRGIGTAVATWLTKNGGVNADSVGAVEVIWWKRMWDCKRRTWKCYCTEKGDPADASCTPCGGNLKPHTDHVHISLNMWNRKNFKEDGTFTNDPPDKEFYPPKC